MPEPELFVDAQAHLGAFEGKLVLKRSRPEGVAIFVRRTLGVPEWRELAYEDGTGHVALAAVVAGVGVATTHLKWQPPATPAEARLGRGELTALLDAWVRPNERWIVTGDLNADARSPVLASAFARGLHDAYASLPDAHTSNANAVAKRIDFILCSSTFEATPTPLPRITDTTPLPSSEEPSDHLPVAATLTERRSGVFE